MSKNQKEFDLSCDLVFTASRLSNHCPNKKVIIKQHDEIVATGKFGNTVFAYIGDNGAIEIDLERIKEN